MKRLCYRIYDKQHNTFKYNLLQIYSVVAVVLQLVVIIQVLKRCSM